MKDYCVECLSPVGCAGANLCLIAAAAALEVLEDGDWQGRDYGDGWITFPDRAAAEKYQARTGALMRFRRNYQASPPQREGGGNG